MYKTQVFVNHEGDHYRTRLTHSLEVAQMSRGVARALRLNEDLAEAIALGHDLGHTPYGHAVEELLGELLKHEGGFYHNEQSIRVVELLEEKSGLEHGGLNLTWEVREGILKHTKDRTKGISGHLLPSEMPSLEAQIVGMVDTIAYVTHDFEDAYESSFMFKDLIAHKIISQGDIDCIWDMLGADKKWGVSSLINKLIEDLEIGTKDAINKYNISCPDDVRKHNEPMVHFHKFDKEFKSFKKFVTDYIYRGPLPAIMDTKAKRIVKCLFESYWTNPEQLPLEIYVKFKNPSSIELKNSYLATQNRVLCDFLSGLTDRYAVILYNKLFNNSERILTADL
jgi:dGTPase